MKVETNLQMYEGAPWCLGRLENFKVNQPQRITLLNHDYVIWRDEVGQLNAIDNVCPHAGASLADGSYLLKVHEKSCLACPYHGNKVQFFGDGKAVIEGNISSQPIQTTLPFKIVDGLVWTYGLHWQELSDKVVAQPIEPKLPIPNYSDIITAQNNEKTASSKLQLENLNHIYSQAMISNCNLMQPLWNIHDGEHFAGTHRDTMLTQEIAIDNLTQVENQLSWKLLLYKRRDRRARFSTMSPLIERTMSQFFHVFLPSLAVVYLYLQDKLIVSTVTFYPQSPTQTRLCLDSYANFDFTWWQKLLKLPKLANQFRDRLIFEDLAIVNNLYSTFEKKITLKNDTPAELAMHYLNNWDS